MAQVTIQQAFELALQRHQAGRLQEAEQLYRQILAQQPGHAESMHHLGLIAQQAGRSDIAADLIRRAISLRPDHAEAHYNLGNALRDTGQIDAAISAYRQAIALHPGLPEAYGNLGNALKEEGQLDAAIEALRRAVALRPDHAQAHSNLGNALKDIGQVDAAIAAHRQAIALNPGFPEAYNNLGNALCANGQLDEARAAYQQAIVLRPTYAEAHNNLGNALKERGQLDSAVRAYRQAIALNPDYPAARYNLGNALKDIGQLDEALAAYRQAIALKPNDAEAHNNLAVVLAGKGQFDLASSAYRQAIALKPDYAEAYSNLGDALRDKGRLEESIAAHRQAITLRPDFPEAHNNLGNALMDGGQLDEAVAAYRQAIALKPDFAIAHSNLVYTLHFHSTYDAKAIEEEHRCWNRRHAEPLAKFIQPHPNDRSPDRRLRVGYVSADFREHPVGRFLLPLLEHHDHRQFQVFCYSNTFKVDPLTARIRAQAQQWRQIVGQSDQDAAARIRADGIDILVDLSGHTAGNRLPVFARKPAPVQVSYLGYPGATGLTTIDYRLTDAWADPPESTDCFHSETVHRLPQSNWCFAQPASAGPVGPSPAIGRGDVTFGSFNNLAKVTESMLQVWARILLAVPNSRLILKAAGLASANSRDRICRQFVLQHIDPGRLILRGWEPTQATHLALHGEVDIALDTFPYHGTSTTCDALWMGVPVVTLAGQSHVSRVGLSLLSNIGLPELVATTVDEYVGVAVNLATDRDRLKRLRLTLRERMQNSPLMDSPTFARNLEAAYRQMWRKWCETVSTS